MISSAATSRPLASAQQWRDALVRALVTAPDERHPPVAFLGHVEESGATVVLGLTGQLIALLPWPEGELNPSRQMRERLQRAMQNPRPAISHIVLIGGGEDAWNLCRELRPPLTTKHRFAFYALDLDGQLRSAWRQLKPLEEAVQDLSERLARGEAVSSLNSQEIALARQQLAEMAKAEQTTFAQLNERRSPATVGLVAAIVLMFGLQTYFGQVMGLNRAWANAGRPDQLLLQMGALSGRAVFAGQWWRLVTCMFLHGGFVHIAVNAWSLWAIGRFLEKVLTTSRFLVLYTLTGIIASVASALQDHFSVGASGAIFGLLGGLMALTYTKQVLPPTISARLRRSLWPVLILNIGISAVPGIDASAHLGGFVSGGVLAWSGLLTWGMPSLMARPVSTPRRSWGAIVAASACVVLMAVCIALAFHAGRPWMRPT